MQISTDSISGANNALTVLKLEKYALLNKNIAQDPALNEVKGAGVKIEVKLEKVRSALGDFNEIFKQTHLNSSYMMRQASNSLKNCKR
jgi:hypothetical protein